MIPHVLVRLVSVISVILLPSFSLATTVVPLKQQKIEHVIYLTLDGVRWQDVFFDHRALPIFWEKHAAHGSPYGKPNTSSVIEVASIPTSLPSYQSQMSGSVQPCFSNNCGRIRVETFPERLVLSGFKKKEVATFSSWVTIWDAVEHQVGTTYVSAGNMPVYDPDTHVADPTMAMLNKKQRDLMPTKDDRLDIYTFAQALHYLEAYRPRFLWIALGDADLAAHVRSRALYYLALSFYDNMIDQLFTRLKQLGIEDKTMVVLTTDHGRGNGPNWSEHGPQFPESKKTWGFVFNGQLVPTAHFDGFDYYSTLSVRPTIESTFGITAPQILEKSA